MVKGDMAYQLHIYNVDQIAWKKKGRPNLYVKVQFEKSVQHTRVAKQNLTPIWNESFPLSGNPSSILRLSVKHDSFLQGFRVGWVDIGVGSLLQMCENNQRATLQLRPVKGVENAETTGYITVQLIAVDTSQLGAAAISHARQDVERSDILSFDVAQLTPIRAISTTNNVPSEFSLLLQNVISKLDVFVQIVDRASKVHPYANFAWQVMSSLYQAARSQMDRDQQVLVLLENMEIVYSFVDGIQSVPNKLRQLENVISQILKQTVECAIFIREYTGRGFTSRAVAQALIDPSQIIQSLINNLNNLKQRFDTGATLQVAFVSSKTLEKVEKLVAIENLKRLNPARMDAFSRSECLPETRQEILKWITDWLITPSGNTNTLWLYGLAGSGKSTISTTIAEYFRELRRLAAFMFFDRRDPTNSQPAIVIRTLSYKLASFIPSIQAAICRSIEDDPEVTEATMRVQFTKLLTEPLGSLTELRAQGPVVVVIDALDECGNHVSRKELLRLLTRELRHFPPCFRFLITSRREPDIEGAFSRCDNIVAKELDITDQSNNSDIYSYIRHHMAVVQEDAAFPLSPHWPGEGKIQALIKSSAGLFIWASTAVKFIADGYDPDQRLDTILQPNAREAESGLDTLYVTALGAVGKWDEGAADFRAVLGVIVVGRIPLSDTAMDTILGLNGSRSSRHILTRLRCLLHWTPGEVVRALHASLPDYLGRCKNLPWSIDVSSHHHCFAVACLRIMKEQLRFNICGLETSNISNDRVPALADRISNNIPAALSYACRFWADHLQEIGFEPCLSAMLKDFFHVRFLYWLEVLSLIEEVGIASQALVTAAKWTEAHDDNLAAFATDANSFVLTFQGAISRSAPHIYISAVPLSPMNSLVSKQYLPQIPRRLSVDIGRVDDWPINVKVLEGHTREVCAVAFSPDGKHVVSGSVDKTVRLWEADTGKVASRPFEGHTAGILSVAFSSDGKQIASSSFDRSIRVWDTETGKLTSKPFTGHTSVVRSVMFSFDGKQIVSGSFDKTVRVWDAETGQEASKPFEGHTGRVYSTAFSPDGKQIVSGSDDKTVRVWDAVTGVSSGPFKGHTGQIYSVDFSPDGKHVASGANDCTIRVWDTKTGRTALGPFIGHMFSIWTVKFSPDGKQIVSGSSDNTVRVWDVETATVISGPFEGHSGLVWSVAFSPDGKEVVSGSLDHTVRIWGVEAGRVAPAPFKGHIGGVHSVVFSPDGKQIASGSTDSTLRLWDTETGRAKIEAIPQVRSAIWAVAFSPDRKHIISGSSDHTIRVWDVETGRMASELPEGHTESIWSVAFSPDGKRFVSGSRDKTIRLWDAQTGNMLSGPLEGHKDAVTCVAFSPDNKYIVSASQDRTVRVWDTETRMVVSGPFEGHLKAVSSAAFSPDGKYIVSGSYDHFVRVWDAGTGEVAFVLEGHGDWVRSVVFSHDGNKILSSSYDRTVRVWDTETRKALLVLEGHTDVVMSAVFSPDSKKIASCSNDQTVRVWDAETGLVDEQTLSGDAQHSADHFQDPPRLVNGWMQNQSELLFWIPHYHRSGLWRARNTAVMGRRITKLNFSQFVYGTSWAQVRDAHE